MASRPAKSIREWWESEREGSGKGLSGKRRVKRGKGLEGQWRVVEGSRGGPDGGVWSGVLAAPAIMPVSQLTAF